MTATEIIKGMLWRHIASKAFIFKNNVPSHVSEQANVKNTCMRSVAVASRRFIDHEASLLAGIVGGTSILLAGQASPNCLFIGSPSGNQRTNAGLTASVRHRRGYMKQQGNPAARLHSLHLAFVGAWHSVQRLWHRAAPQ